MEEKKKSVILCFSWYFADSELSENDNYLYYDNGGERAIRNYYLYRAFSAKYEVKVLCYKNYTALKENIIEVPFSQSVFRIFGFLKKKVWRGFPGALLLSQYYCDLMLKKHVKGVDNFIFFPVNELCVSKAHKKNMKTFYNPITPPFKKFNKIQLRHNDKEKSKIIKKFYQSVLRKMNSKHYINSEKKCDVILTESKYNERLYSKEFPNKKVVSIFSCHHEKIEKNLYLSEKKDNISRLLFVGHNFIQKNVEQLIHIFLKMKLRKVKLVICGNYNISQPNRKIYDQYRHCENIEFEGSVIPQSYYKSCDIFVFPTIYEGGARVCFEAMSYGMPIVTTEESGAPIDKKNFVSLEDLEQELTEKLSFLIDNKEALHNLSEENFQLSKQFYVEKYVKSYVNYVEPFLK